MSGIKLLILDLDMCVFNTDTQRPMVIRVMQQLLEACGLPEAQLAQVVAALKDRQASPISIANQFGLPPDVVDAMLKRYRTIEIHPDARTYGDEHHVAALGIEKVLVTAGYAEVQNRKIDHLGIRPMFTEVHIDVIADDGSHIGKQRFFEDIMSRRGLKPHQVVVLGDNPLTELGAGKRLQMHTVQTVRPGITRWPGADHHISSFSELAELIGRIEESLLESA